jgi:hypothetical protein
MAALHLPCHTDRQTWVLVVYNLSQQGCCLQPGAEAPGTVCVWCCIMRTGTRWWAGLGGWDHGSCHHSTLLALPTTQHQPPPMVHARISVMVTCGAPRQHCPAVAGRVGDARAAVLRLSCGQGERRMASPAAGWRPVHPLVCWQVQKEVGRSSAVVGADGSTPPSAQATALPLHDLPPGTIWCTQYCINILACTRSG